MKRIKVLIVDDHPIFLEGLKTVLSLRDPEIEIVGTALEGHEALERDEELQPDVVLADIKMPVMDGVTLAGRLLERRTSVKIIMLTTFDDRDLIQDALDAGAKGYMLKGSKPETVIHAIKYVNEGNVILSGDLAAKLSSTERVSDSHQTSHQAIIKELSARELQILRLVANGMSNPEIARRLGITEKTVRNYVSHIYEILDVHTRTKAVLWALKNLDRTG